MVEQKRFKEDSLVEEINIEHNFDQYIKAEITKAKLSLSLPNISTKDLLRRLKEDKRDALYNNLTTLLKFKKLHHENKSYIKTLI